MAFVNLLQAVYTVGTIYCSTVNTSPSSFIGGTWVQITDATLRGATTNGYVGSDTHVQTIEEMPSHNHKYTSYFWRTPATSYNEKQYLVAHTNNDGTTPSANSGFSTAVTGGGQAMSLVQRSYNCFIWYRVS